MVLKVTMHKESPKQSFPKVTSEAAVRRCSSKCSYRKTSLSESLFNKVAGLTASNFI